MMMTTMRPGQRVNAIAGLAVLVALVLAGLVEGQAGRKMVLMRPPLPKANLSVSIHVSQHKRLDAVAEADRPLPQFDLREKMKDAERYIVPGGSDTATFYVHTSDADLDGKLSFARPGVFAFGSKVHVEVAEWGAVFLPVSVLANPKPNQDTLLLHSTPFTLKFTCRSTGPTKVVVHVNVLPTPPGAKAANKKKMKKKQPQVPTNNKRRLLGVSGEGDDEGTGEGGGGEGEGSGSPSLSSSSSSGNDQNNNNQNNQNNKDNNVRTVAVAGPPRPPEHHKLISFVVVKQCDKVHEFAVPGLDVSSDAAAGPDFAHGDVVVNGMVTPPFNVSRPSHVVPAEEVATTLYVRYASRDDKLPHLKIKRPVVTSSSAVDVTATVAGTSSRALNVSGGSVRALVVNYRCRREARATLTIQLPTSLGPVTFALIKECKGRTQGYFVKGFNVGTQPRGTDVVQDGYTKLPFIMTTAKTEHKNTVIERDETQRIFHMWTQSKDVRIDQPIAVAESIGVEEKVVVAIVKGPAPGKDKGPVRLSPEVNDYPMQINFSCLREGEAQVTVHVPLRHSPGIVSFSMTKRCPPLAEKAAEAIETALAPEKRFVRILNFNILYRGTGQKLVSDGLPVDRVFHAKPAHMFAPLQVQFVDRDYIEFRRKRRRDSRHRGPYTRTIIRASRPVVVTDMPILAPELSGPGDAALTYRNETYHSLTVNFNCLGPGHAIVTVDIPIKMQRMSYNEAGHVVETKVSRESLQFSIHKECGADTSQNSLGGVAVPGFCVGRNRMCDVVQDGFPTPAYFAQRHRSSPAWDDIMLTDEEDALQVFFSYNITAYGSGPPSVAFRAPTVIGHSDIFEVELSGDGVVGGTLHNSSDAIDLSVNFRCLFSGVGSATVSVPFPHGTVRFTVPKECKGEEQPVGLRIGGLHVGTEAGKNDVVRNGITQPEYTAYSIGDQGDRVVVKHDEDSTTFYIQRKSPFSTFFAAFQNLVGGQLHAPPMHLLEPYVYATRPYANPVIQHTLQPETVQVRDGEEFIEEDSETLLVTEEPAKIVVVYNCIWNGVTPITISVPVLPHAQLTWMVTKQCNGLGGDPNVEVSPSPDDEVRWQAEHPLNLMDGSEVDGSVGYVNIGTGTFDSVRDDVVSRGRPQLEYSLPYERNGGGGASSTSAAAAAMLSDSALEDDENEDFATSVVLAEDEHESTFYVSVPEGSQRFEHPQSRTVANPETGHLIVRVRLGGEAASGGVVNASHPLELRVSYECLAPGVAPILISLPLLPHRYGYTSFRYHKVCGGFKARTSFTWTTSNVIAVASFVGMLVLLVWCSRSKVMHRARDDLQRPPSIELPEKSDERL